jgi:uncharacterized damage-inducible protein DinB
MKKISKPTKEIPPFYQHYMSKVPEDGKLLKHLASIMAETEKLVLPLTEEQLTYRYSEGKWTIKDIIVHLSDCERVIIYQAMRFARADKTALPGFDENLFAENAHANNRDIKDMLNELKLTRKASIAFIKTLDDEALDRTSVANGFHISARLLVNHIYGHHRHHLHLIRERYIGVVM